MTKGVKKESRQFPRDCRPASGQPTGVALDKHAGRNARRASERAAAKDALEELEVKEVRRAIAETSLLRVDAPVFIPRAFPAPQ